MVDYTKGNKEWLERNNITSNIRDYLENTLHETSEQIEHFFETYPELEFQSFLPPTPLFLFFLVPVLVTICEYKDKEIR